MTIQESIEKSQALFLSSNHNWEKNEDGEVEWFAFSNGHHNGPACVDCGYYACIHCNKGDSLPECICSEKR